MTRILIADDHPLVRDGLRSVLSVVFDRCEMFEAESLSETLDLVERERDFDLVLLDVNMPGNDGLEGLRQLRERFAALPVVMISAVCEARQVEEAIRRGAAGFLPKSLPCSEVAAALGRVLAGEVFIPANVESTPHDTQIAEIENRIASLTPQQRAVLRLVVAGRLNKEIAYLLGVTETTVKAHVSAILQKMQVFSRTQAVILANQVGFEGAAQGGGSVRAATV
jgi:DNA-binding NarL/FixJ family response regulator